MHITFGEALRRKIEHNNRLVMASSEMMFGVSIILYITIPKAKTRKSCTFRSNVVHGPEG